MTAGSNKKSEPKRFSYGVGASAVVAISIGVAVIVYALGMLPFNVVNFLGWIFAPLGVYTVIYSLVARREGTYYLAWGTILVAVAVIMLFYNTVNLFIVLGIVVILLAVIGVFAYMRGKE